MDSNFVVRKLNTKEDNFYIHKLLGTVCFINYMYRFFSLFYYGNMSFNQDYDMFSVFLHGLLSTSSLIFHIPSVRNPQAPMIYPEFRLHSIIFALRSVICCFISYMNIYFAYKIAVCLTTTIIADIITSNYKQINNGKTMNNVPFEKSISLDDQKKITHMHSSMQIAATLYMLGNTDTAYSPMFAIQIAAFLMTLVRKNIISSNSWHILYAFSLWIGSFVYMSPILPIDYITTQIILYHIYTKIFFKYRTNKYMNWSIVFGLYSIKQIYAPNFFENTFFTNPSIAFYFRCFLVILFFVREINKTKSLFVYTKNITHRQTN